MFQRILVALDHTAADHDLLTAASSLARFCGGSLLLLHVADGWAARHFKELNLAESEEMREDLDRLESAAAALRESSLSVDIHLALGEPAKQILAVAKARQCDLIIMISHGHRLIGDLLHGETIETVRHRAKIPLLIIPAGKKAQK
jgi:manganese transport protein